MSSDLDRAAQLGAGALISALFVSVGLVLLLGLNREPAAWGGALVLTGASYGFAIAFVVIRGRSRRETS